MEGIEDDPRFSHIASDPKFKPMPKSKKKVKIDSRFQSLFTSQHFTIRTDMDKRGKPVRDSKKKSKHTMERFYAMSESDTDESDKDENEEENEIGLEVKVKDRVKVKKVKPLDEDDNKDESADGEEEEDDDEDGESEEEEDEESEEEEDLPEYSAKYDIEETEVDHKWNELQNDATEVSESSRRLAVCNMDWDFVKAQDLFVLFKSFVPEGGSLNSVAIYTSEFGKERMAEEAMLGPKEMRNNLQNGKNDNEEDKKKKKGKKIDEKKEKRMNKESNEVHREKLREYQLNRLKYYYAVVDCDSVRTADAVYTECDSREYQLSSIILDLRYIPDDMTFEDEPREIFTESQTTVDYQPSTFQSSALSQAKVEVTWDETDFDRLSRRVSALQSKELESIVEENKYSDIIAPPESDSEDETDQPEWLKNVLAQEDDSDGDDDEEGEGNDKKFISEEKKIKMYRQLFMDKIADEEEEKQKEDDNVDKIMEFQPGLKTSVAKNLMKKEKKKEDSAVVGEYLEKKKEKKKKKRERKKQELATQEEDGAFSDDDLPENLELDDSMREMMKGEEANFVDKGKKKKKKKKKFDDELNEEEKREKAELELILMRDDGSKKIAKPEKVDESKSKKRKSKKQMAKLKKADKKEAEDFVLDVEDNRFNALYTSHLFHIDPTAPQYKKTKNMVRLVDEQIKRKKQKSGKKRGHDGSESAQGEVGMSQQSSKSVSQSLVESLKKKMKKS